MVVSNLSLMELIKGFELSCQAEGKSHKTIEWYVCFLNRFARFVKQQYLTDTLDLIDKQQIRTFIRYLQVEAQTPRTNKQLSPTTVQGYVRTLKAFYSWLHREDYVKYNTMTDIPIPRAPVKIIDTLTNDQIAILLDACRKSKDQSYRD